MTDDTPQGNSACFHSHIQPTGEVRLFLLGKVDHLRKQGLPDEQILHALIDANQTYQPPLSLADLVALLQCESRPPPLATQNTPQVAVVNDRLRWSSEDLERETKVINTVDPRTRFLSEEEMEWEKPPVHLSLMEYLGIAVVQWERWIGPVEYDDDFKLDFQVLRAINAHPSVRALSGTVAFRRADHALRELIHKDDVEDPWSEWGTGSGHQDFETLFIDKWHTIRFPLGETLWSAAIDRAETCPLRLSREDRLGRNEGYVRLLTLAGWMQVLRGPKPILIPLERFGEHFHVRPKTISAYRAWAVDDGDLIKCGKSPRGADQFWFCVDNYPLLEKAANDDLLDAVKEARQTQANTKRR